jgi:hypothetical protein
MIRDHSRPAHSGSVLPLLLTAMVDYCQQQPYLNGKL